MRRLLRIVLTVVILSVVVVVALQFVQAGRDPQAEADSPASLIQDETIVSLGDLAVTVSATGPVAPARQVSLSFETVAPVREVLVSEGQAVLAGDVLARLDTSDLEAALANAQLALESQQVAFAALITPAREPDIAAAQAAVDAARASVAAAALGPDATQEEIARMQAELARNQLWQAQLQRDLSFTRGPIPGLDFDPLTTPLEELGPITVPGAADSVTPAITQAETGVQLADVTLADVANQGPDAGALASANAQLVAAQVQLDRLLNGPSEYDLRIAESQLQIAALALEQAQAALDRAILVAPFDGIVTTNNLVIGELPPQGAAMQIIDASSYHVEVSVDETDIVELQVGQAVTLDFDALPDARITGAVTRINALPVRAGQLVTYSVQVLLDPTDEPVRVGMTATATIVVRELQNVVTLPNRFIRIDRATQQAFVTILRSDSQFEELRVELGLRNETESEIVTGLEPGQRVVLVPRETFNPFGP